MRRFFKAYDVYIGHYITLFDIPVVERLLGIKVEGQLIDTLPLSWYLFHTKEDGTKRKHGLEYWGEEFGVPKPQITDWFSQDIETYIHRCEEDVKINCKLWMKINEYLKRLYSDARVYNSFTRYLQFKMDTVREQEAERWKLDIDKTRVALAALEEEEKIRFKQVVENMPKVPVMAKRTKPSVMIKKDGSPSKNALGWYNLLASQGLSQLHEGPVEVITGYSEPKPSTTQLKKWLFSLGWEPQTFKTNDKGEEVPQINLPNGAGLCESVKELYEVEPRLEVLDGYFVIRHRITVLSGFLRDVSADGYLTASVSGLTNTLRFKHSTIVNLPKVDKLHAQAIRGSLTCPSGYTLCGADLASLEDRLKQHYIYPYDPDYVATMLEDGFDPHMDLAALGEIITQEQYEEFKQAVIDEDKTTQKKYKAVRDPAKTTNYACQYGAGPAKIAKSANVSLERGKFFHELYWKRNWAVKRVAEEQEVKYIGDDMWLKNPVNGFYYSLRSQKDKFSTLVQGTASYAFDVWLGYIRKAGIKITGQFHDEFIAKVKEDETEEIYTIVKQAMDDTNALLKLNRELGFECKFGKYYGDIH